MAYDTYQAERLTSIFKEKNVPIILKKMMGGLCVMVDDKMCLGLLQDKEGKNILMIRIGEDIYRQIESEDYVKPMDFTGRPMRGYAFVEELGFDMDEDLERWVDLCLQFNPQAKRSKKKK